MKKYRFLSLIFALCIFTTLFSVNTIAFDATVKKIYASMPTEGKTKILAIYVDFPDNKYSSDAYSAEKMKNELFGNEKDEYPFESVSAYFNRSSYGKLNVDGDVVTYTAKHRFAFYEPEMLAKETLKALDSKLDYSDYDADKDGFIDCFSITVPLDGKDDATLEKWYGCTITWDSGKLTLDGKSPKNYILNDVMPYKENMTYLKEVLIHEMGHCMGLPDYYMYNTEYSEGLNGDAGIEMMDENEADFCGVSKLFLGWTESKNVKIAKTNTSKEQTFFLTDASKFQSGLILPIKSNGKDIPNEFFYVEYVTPSKNNYGSFYNGGIRIFHVEAELYKDYCDNYKFKYNNYSEYYTGDDGIRVIRLVNDGNGFFSSGNKISFKTSGFAGYDKNGKQTVDTHYSIYIGKLTNGKYKITVKFSK